MLMGGNVISSVEFHGNMSLVIFLATCPLRCRYCHNVELLEGGTETSFTDVKKTIDSSADFIDAVVVSGGEPLVQAEAVAEIFRYVKSVGLKTKLDTSGIYPKKLEKLLNENLVDYISLDVKAPFSKYRKIVGSNIGHEVRQSMKIINEHENVHLEIRTTYVPTLHTKKDIVNLVDDIEAEIYTLQQFRNKNVLDPALEEVENPNPHELRKIANSLKPYFNGVIKLKTGDFGEEIIE